MDKHYISANELLDDSFRLAHVILKSGFKPDYIVGVWRGGTPVGIAVQEYLDFRGSKSDHTAIRTASYTGIGTRDEAVQVLGLEYLVENIKADDKLLIVDDVFDTGLSLEAIIGELEKQCAANMPKDTRVATVYYKPENRKAKLKLDYYIHESNQWLVFPHEMQDLTVDEINQNKSPLIAELLAEDL